MTLAPRVSLVIYNPIIEAEGGSRLNRVLGWNDPDQLCAQYIADVQEASHGYVRYQIVERIELDEYPVKQDGFRYDDAGYLHAWRARSGFHQPDTAPTIRRSCSAATSCASWKPAWWMNSGSWLSPTPAYTSRAWAGAARSGATARSSPARRKSRAASRSWVLATSAAWARCSKTWAIVPRASWNMSSAISPMKPEARSSGVGRGESGGRGGTGCSGRSGYGNRRSNSGPSPTINLSGNLWKQFTRYDKSHPGMAACGNVHFAPSSEADYDWGNRRPVWSNADDWLNYPNFTGQVREMTCADWGGGDIRQHHLWWMKRFPHVEGTTPTGKLNNWWRYIVGLEF